jgi:hypothetical protein
LYIDNKMTHWKAAAALVDPPIPEEDAAQAVAALERLEAEFRPLAAALDPAAPMWTGPEDAE